MNTARKNGLHYLVDGNAPAHSGQAERALRWAIVRVPRKSSRECLSTRELDVLALIAGGQTDAEIAARLSISPRTVGTHISNMLTKTGLTNRMQLVIWALAAEVIGLIPQQ